MPKISVIMPAYNAERYIREAIDSILRQTWSDFELIIIDDGSTDSTAAIIAGYTDNRIRFCPNAQNMGVAATLNRGLELACGAYIARMDADDISLPERFAKQAAYLDAHPDVTVCGTAIELFFPCGIAHPSVMMRRAAILELGGYDPAFNGMEDYELWCRVAEKGKIAVLPEILLRYRIHSGQVTQNPSPKFKEQMQNLKRRQLAQLGVTAEPEEFSAYAAYCIGTIETSYAQAAALGRCFEKAAAGNEASSYYRSDFLCSDFKSILLRLAAKLSRQEQKRLCAECSLITEKALRQRKLKTFARKLLGRS